MGSMVKTPRSISEGLFIFIKSTNALKRRYSLYADVVMKTMDDSITK